MGQHQGLQNQTSLPICGLHATHGGTSQNQVKASGCSFIFYYHSIVIEMYEFVWSSVFSSHFYSIIILQKIDYAVADIRDVDAVREALNICSTRFGLPNLIVNNAAGNLLCPSERLSPDAFSSVIDIVLKGTGIVTLEVAKALIKAKQSE